MSLLRTLSAVTLAVLLAAAVAGCGIRGPLEPPPSAEKPATTAGTTPEETEEAKEAGAPSEDGSFILDALVL
ncbi:MAG: lipoprotein [Pseudomonadota bacterium]